MSRLSAMTAATLLGVAVFGTLSRAQTERSNSESSAAATPLDSQHRGSKQHAAERIEAILRQPLKAPLEFIETPLNQVMQIISEEYELQVFLDVPALDALAVSPEAEVSVNLRNISLDSALELILRSPALEDVTFIVDEEVLLITSQEEADRRLSIRVYRVDDLVLDPVSGELDFDSLVALIVTSVEYDAWQEHGSGEGTIQPLRPGILVVSQTWRVHKQLTDLLQEIREVAAEITSGEDHAEAKLAGQPVTRAIRMQHVGGDDGGRVRQILSETIQRSVDWQSQDGLAGEEPYLAILPDRVVVRHLPQVVAEVQRLITDLELAPPKQSGGRGGGGGFGGGGGGFGGGGYF